MGVGTIVGAAGTQEGMNRRSSRERNIRLDMDAVDKKYSLPPKRKGIFDDENIILLRFQG
jgi:hypothetical protein